MKKILLLTAFLLPGFSALSQEAEDPGNKYAEVTVVSRLDLDPEYSFEDSGIGFTHGNSSIYTLFEGSFSEHLSWTVVNHWISSLNGEPDIDYGWPYKSLGRSDTSNWLDYCKLDLSFGQWGITLGKDMLGVLGYEYDPWDWEVHFPTCTPLASELTVCQWGAKVAYTTASGLSNFSLQMTTSPCGEHPFSSGIWAFNGRWSGEYGFYSPIWSYTAIQYDRGSFRHILNFGNKFTFNDSLDLCLDYSLSPAVEKFYVPSYNCLRAELAYDGPGHFGCNIQGYVHFADEYDGASFSAGAYAYYYPLSEDKIEDLRLHAGLSYDSSLSCATLSIGALFNLHIRCW